MLMKKFFTQKISPKIILTEELLVIQDTVQYSGTSLFINNRDYTGVLISGCWNREVPLYTEVSSFQEVRMELLISGGWNKGVPLYYI